MSTLQDYENLLQEKNLPTEKVKEILSSAEGALSPADFARFKESANKKMNNKDIRYDEPQKDNVSGKSFGEKAEDALKRIPERQYAAILKTEKLDKLRGLKNEPSSLSANKGENTKVDQSKAANKFSFGNVSELG